MRISFREALLLAAASPGSAWAQSPPAQTGASDATQLPDADEDVAIKDVVVTARKLQENLQEVPLSITAFTAEDLARRGVREVSDLSNLAPGLNFEKDFGRRFDRPTIRGQSNILGVPNAASFIDGVFIPDSLFSTELAFVERVEIIKGPQSALYGRQTFSGAISYVTRKPTDRAEAAVRGTIAEDGEYDALVSASGPLVPGKLYAQIATNFYGFGGQYRNLAPGDPGDGRKVGQERTRAVTGALVFKPVDALSITVRGTFSKNRDGLEAIALQSSKFNNCFPNAAGTFRYYCGEVRRQNAVLGANTGSLPDFGGIFRQTKRVSGIVDYDFGPVSLALVSGWNDAKERRLWDIDNTSVQTGNRSRNVNDILDIESFSQEARLQSTGNGALSWILGGYYYRERDFNARYTYSTGVLTNNGFTRIRNLSAFGLVRYRFTDALTASAEVRYGEDKLALVGGNANFNLQAKYKSWNPRFTLDYKVADDFLIYGVAAHGNKPGGFNSDVRLPLAARTFGEENAWNYEVGFKSDLFDRRLRLNAALFQIDWKDQQLTQSIIIPQCTAGQVSTPVLPCLTGPAQTTSYIINVGSAKIRGVEAEAIVAITRGLRLNASLSYNDSKFTSGTDAEVGTLTGNNSLVGKEPPNSPRFQYSLGATIDVPVTDDWNLVASGDYGYRSRKYDQVGNFAWVPGRGVANARIAFENRTLTLAVFGRNLFNNLDPVTATRWSDFTVASLPRAFRASLPRQRQIGATIEARF